MEFLKQILENSRLIRNYRTSYNTKKPTTARLWLEKTVMSAAQFTPGEGLVVDYFDNYLSIRSAKPFEAQTHKVHHRNQDPLFDLGNKHITTILGVCKKIDIVVKLKEIFIYKEFSYDMILVSEPFKRDENLKFKVVSLFAGGGGMTSAFTNTEACESVFAVDSDIPNQTPFNHTDTAPSYTSWTIETFRMNFPNTLLYWGDIKSLNTSYIPKADIVCVSPPCTTFSKLGDRTNGIVEHFAPHIARIILATGARAVFFENVPDYFKSNTFQTIKRMLSSVFEAWHVKTINSYELGSIESRNRGYAVAFRENNSFQFPTHVKTPNSKRVKVKNFLDDNAEDWLSIKGSSMENFLTKHKKTYSENTGFTINKNNTLVTHDATKVSCFVKGYMKRQTVCSYLKHPSDDSKWRLFTPTEIMKMMSYPEWFRLPLKMPKTRKYEILGNSVNVRVIESIASNIINTLMELKICEITKKKPSCLFCT